MQWVLLMLRFLACVIRVTFRAIQSVRRLLLILRRVITMTPSLFFFFILETSSHLCRLLCWVTLRSTGVSLFLYITQTRKLAKLHAISLSCWPVWPCFSSFLTIYYEIVDVVVINGRAIVDSWIRNVTSHVVNDVRHHFSILCSLLLGGGCTLGSLLF